MVCFCLQGLSLRGNPLLIALSLQRVKPLLLVCNRSNPLIRAVTKTPRPLATENGQVPKWTKGADCKSVAIGFQGSNPCLPTIKACWEVPQGLGGRSSVVEFQPSKLDVAGSNPVARSIEDVIRYA
jgi:hypothetical protein